jgi:NAD(P)H-dependent FMN reductase
VGSGKGPVKNMPTILALSGSVRTGSFNTMLLRALVDVAPADTIIDVGSIGEVPLYNGDWEAANGVPAAVQQLKDRLAAADGLLLVSPEYNNSIPGVFKNAIDWMSRPASDIPRVFGGKPVAIAGATPGQGGTMLSQAAWLPVIRTLGMLPWFQGRLTISGAGKVFDSAGTIQDVAIKERVRTFIEGFARFVERESSAAPPR